MKKKKKMPVFTAKKFTVQLEREKRSSEMPVKQCQNHVSELSCKAKAVNAVGCLSQGRFLMLGVLSKGFIGKGGSLRLHELQMLWLDDGRGSSRMTEHEGDWSEWGVSKKQHQAAERPPQLHPDGKPQDGLSQMPLEAKSVSDFL